MEPAGPPAKRARMANSLSDVVVYPGEEGSLAHEAARRLFEGAPDVRLEGVSSFSAAFEEVAGARALHAVVPIENSASGTLHSTYDLLIRHDVVIAGELGVREVYCLCGRAGVALSAVRRVVSHPAIIEACSTFLATKLGDRVEEVAAWSTTEAARDVASASSSDASASASASAAIATRQAAEKHGLQVLAEDIGNDAFLETRYIAVRRPAGPAADRPAPFANVAAGVCKKQSACFAVKNEPGAIFKLLSCWALRNIDVLKVETRPLSALRAGLPGGRARLWDYLFYVDYAVPVGQTQEANARLWDSLREFSLYQRDFGAYDSKIDRAEKQPRCWAEMVDLMAK